MSSDLTSAFGMPAADLQSRLRPNPRRERRERPPDATPPSPPPAESEPDTTDTTDVTDGGSASTNTVEDARPDGGAQVAASEATATPVPVEAGRARSTNDTSGAARRSGGTATARRGSGGRPRSGRAPQNLELDASTSYSVPVYIHPAVRVAAVNQRKDAKSTNAEIAFNAIDDVQHRLPGLIRDRRLQARPDTSLFPGRVRRGRLAGGGAASAAGDARRVLYQLRATEAELEIIDRLVSENGAESRSELIAVAMEESLLRGR